jgi:hypothetical protein
MRKMAWVLTVAALGTAGCSTDFAPETDIQVGVKTRPLTVICEPPEAVPGEMVTVTTRFYDPDAGSTDLSWVMALDYRLDRYDQQEYEGLHVDLDPLLYDLETEVSDDGLVRQRFRFDVPDSCLLVSGAVPETIEIELPPEIEEIIQPEGAYPTKVELDTFFATTNPEHLSDAGLLWAQTASDFFACQIRLRAQLTGGIPLAITKNLTVRYSRRFGSRNVNTNPEVWTLGIITVHAADVDDRDDIVKHETDTTYVYHKDPGYPVESTIPVASGKTYYMFVRHSGEVYRSPAGILHDETHEYFWYSTRFHPAEKDEHFFVTDSGEEAEMRWLDHIVRIKPPLNRGSQRYLIHSAVRDFRPEWRLYHATPGAALVTVDLLFDPQ